MNRMSELKLNSTIRNIFTSFRKQMSRLRTVFTVLSKSFSKILNREWYIRKCQWTIIKLYLILISMNRGPRYELNWNESFYSE